MNNRYPFYFILFILGIGIASAVTLDAGTVFVLDDINITLANNLTFDNWIEVGSNYTAFNDSGWTSIWTVDSDNHLTGTLDEWTMPPGSEQYIYSILSSGLLTDYDQTIKVEDNESYYLLFKDGYLDSVLDTDANGNISFSDSDTIPTTTEFEIEKERPNLISPTNGSSETYEYPPLTNRIEFDWTDSGAPAWNIQVSKTVGFTVLAVDAYVSTNNSSYNLPVGYDYWWRVRSYYEDDDFTGNWTDAWTFEVNSTTTFENNTTAIHGIVQTPGNSPISSATVTIYNNTFSDSMVTGSNGYYIFDELAGGQTYYLQATRDGYEASSILSVTAINNTVVTKNIILQKETAPTYITPHYVRLIPMYLWLITYDDLTVTVYEGDSATALYSEITGDDGAVNFELSETTKYRITVKNTERGIDDTFYITPSDDEYILPIGMGEDKYAEEDILSDITYSMTKSRINLTAGYINISYSDPADTFTSASVLITYTNNTTIYSSSSSVDSGSFSTIVNASNTTYIATLTIIDSGIEGNFKKTSVIDFIDSIQDEFDMGWENEWNYLVFAIVIIILLGTIAGAVHAPVIALIQGAFFLIFLDIGYIPTRLDIVFMGALGIVISYMAAMRKGEEGMRS